ncbi:MAG: protein-export chaperone SecB [Rhodospirillaceae bacterium]|nr:protein-export chaperone SecB [Rhodospirillaceae bacterium]
MAEKDATNAEAVKAAGAADAGRRGQPITVNLQYINDLSFENPKAPHSLAGQKDPPQVSVAVEVKARTLGPNVYEVVIEIHSEAKVGAETVFVVELAYAGIFTLEGVPENAVGAVLLIECPRLLFPFARSIIANATRDGGFPPLMINPVDFVEMFRRNQGAPTGAGAPASPVPGGTT